jgi:hypothetical protein
MWTPWAASQIHSRREIALPTMNMAYCCDTHTNFAGWQLGVLANPLITFYIVRPLLLKIVAMRPAILKIKDGLAYLTMDLIDDLKG